MMIVLKYRWQKAFDDRKFIFEFFGALAILILSMLIFSRFVQFVELRDGILLNDFLLRTFEAVDLSWPIFIMIYGAIFFAISVLIFAPSQLVILFEAYALMVLTRMLLMFFVPLEPPSGMILLQDPFVEFFGQSKTLTKDLFFSGHTASLFLLYLAVPKRVKWIFLFVTMLVAVGVLLQKVHYTVDVLVAPLISFGCYYLTSRIRQKLIQV